MGIVYINRNTGEVFNAEKVTLENLCGGWVSEQFTRDMELLASRMAPDDNGSITIEIKVAKQFDGEGAECLLIGAESNLKLPKVKMVDTNVKHISSDGEVVIKGERQNLFDTYTDESHQLGNDNG